MTRVLYVWNHDQPFISTDERLLRDRFEVESFHWRGGPKSIVSGRRLRKAMRGADLAFTRFAGVHAAAMVRAARRLNIASVVVLGGYDVADIHDPRYGAFSNAFEAPFARYCLRHATRLLPNDDGLAKDALRIEPSVQGRMEMIPNGYDADAIPSMSDTTPASVLTVAAGASWNRARIKGLDRFVAVARLLPLVPFTVLGATGDALQRLQSGAPSNVTFLPPAAHDAVLAAMRNHRVYAQFSMREGCPNALCEAMLSGAAPVGTDVQGVRTVIADAGGLAPEGDVEAMAAAVQAALDDPEAGQRARRRIVDHFSLHTRRQSLHRVVADLTAS